MLPKLIAFAPPRVGVHRGEGHTKTRLADSALECRPDSVTEAWFASDTFGEQRARSALDAALSILLDLL